MVLEGGSRQLDSRLPATFGGSRGQHDIVFTFYGETWTDARRRDMYMAGDRLLETLMSSPAVRSLVVANPYRSAPIQWARRLAGQRPAPFPDAPHRVLIEPRSVRRARSHVGCARLERAYATYDRAPASGRPLGWAPANPVVITTSPFVAGFAPLRWARRVTFYAWDDWMSGLPVRHWWPAYEEAYAARPRSRAGRSSPCRRRSSTASGRPARPPSSPTEWRRRNGDRRLRRRHGSPLLPSPRILYVGVLDDRLDVDGRPRGRRSLLQRDGRPPRADRRPNGAGSAAQPCERPDRAARGSGGRSPAWCTPPMCASCRTAATRLTAAMSPLKLYEYLAGGRPVAATDLPPVRAVRSQDCQGAGRRELQPTASPGRSTGGPCRGRTTCVHRRQFVAATPR